MFKRTFLCLSLALAITGCSTGVKLDEAPVEDRNASSVTPAPAGSTSGAVAAGQGTQSRVAPVAADSSAGSAAGPASVARIVYFDYDSYAIAPQYQGLIDGHAQFLKGNASRHVIVEGHTDERGGREYNLALGQRRAEAVRRALGLLGVQDKQVEAVSFGKEKPAATGSDEAAWSKNRRAEIVYR